MYHASIGAPNSQYTAKVATRMNVQTFIAHVVVVVVHGWEGHCGSHEHHAHPTNFLRRADLQTWRLATCSMGPGSKPPYKHVHKASGAMPVQHCLILMQPAMRAANTSAQESSQLTPGMHLPLHSPLTSVMKLPVMHAVHAVAVQVEQLGNVMEQATSKGTGTADGVGMSSGGGGSCAEPAGLGVGRTEGGGGGEVSSRGGEGAPNSKQQERQGMNLAVHTPMFHVHLMDAEKDVGRTVRQQSHMWQHSASTQRNRLGHTYRQMQPGQMDGMHPSAHPPTYGS
jgi:hypothetical protein